MSSCQIGDLTIQVIPASENTMFFDTKAAELRLSKPGFVSVAISLNEKQEDIITTLLRKKYAGVVLAILEAKMDKFPISTHQWIQAAREVLSQQSIAPHNSLSKSV